MALLNLKTRKFDLHGIGLTLTVDCNENGLLKIEADKPVYKDVLIILKAKLAKFNNVIIEEQDHLLYPIGTATGVIPVGGEMTLDGVFDELFKLKAEYRDSTEISDAIGKIKVANTESFVRREADKAVNSFVKLAIETIESVEGIELSSEAKRQLRQRFVDLQISQKTKS